jgi:DNA polymerase-3 subunit gamma/tau
MICAAEGVEVDPNALSLIIRAAGGSARDAESLLDQLLAASGGDQVTYADAATTLGFTDAALLDETIEAMAARDAAGAFAAAERAIEVGLDPRRFAEDLLQCLRDLLLLHTVPNAGEAGLIDLPADTIDRMLTQAPRIGPAAMSRAAEILARALTEMRGTVPPRLVLELAMARILLPRADDDQTAVLARLDELERHSETQLPNAIARLERLERLLAHKVADTQPDLANSLSAVAREERSSAVRADAVDDYREAGPPSTASPSSGPQVATSEELTLESLGGAWANVLEVVKQKSPVAAAQLRHCAQIAGLADKTLTLVFQPTAVATQFEHRSHILAEALREVFDIELGILCTGAIPEPSSAAWPASAG